MKIQISSVFATIFLCTLLAPSREVRAQNSIRIVVDKSQVGEGLNVVIDAAVSTSSHEPAPKVTLHAKLDGKDWGADYLTIPSGVAHLVMPMPERGIHQLSVTDGTVVSNAVEVEVTPRHFDLVNDPDHMVVMEYETWFGPGYAEWGHEEAIPILGHYSSLDSRIIRQHALWFNDLGIDTVELDWTNNLTSAFPNKTARECMAGTQALLDVYLTMAQHPKVVLLMGPENNLWRDSKQDIYAGPWFKQQMEYVYDHYINNPKYRGLFVQYEGKPLILYYLNGPRSVAPPDLSDAHFTTRYVGAWLQFTKEEKYGVWSWYDQDPVPTIHDGKVEALTVTDGYPSVNKPGKDLDNWTAIDAGGKNYGETYRRQWQTALRVKPRFLFINQWNEFVPPDQYNVNLSNDMEPTIMTEVGDDRPSGWGFEYMNITKDYIREYRQAIQSK
jgi:hypothetical protein